LLRSDLGLGLAGGVWRALYVLMTVILVVCLALYVAMSIIILARRRSSTCAGIASQVPYVTR